MISRRRAVALLFALLAVSAAFIQISDERRLAEEALIQRRYAEAVQHLEAALAEEPRTQQPAVLVLLARARGLAGDLEGALAAYQQLARDFPDSDRIDRAACERAELLAGARRFREAAAIYRDQIERLIGADRKEEIAATYLGLADRALQGETPDYDRAVAFYDLALELGLGVDKARAVRLLAAEALRKAGKHGPAIARYDALVKELASGPARRRAQLGLGRSKIAAGQQAQARTVLRDLIADDATAEEAGDAMYEIALSFGVPRPVPAALDRAVAAVRELQAGYPAHPQARIGEFLIGQCYAGLDRTEAALTAFRAFLETHGDESLDEVPLARAWIGDLLWSQERLDEAIDAWRAYLSAHPAHSEWERVQRAIVDAEYGRAELAARDERRADARELFERFLREHPLDQRNPGILDRLGGLLVEEEQFEAAIAAFERCVKTYPDRDESSHAQFRIGEIRESNLFEFARAIAAYEAVTWGAWRGLAQGRIAQLKRKSLEVRTPRTFRSGEPAHFLLTSRNVPQVRVRVYRLDLESWFRATHLPGSVEQLDIEVIEPDRVAQDVVGDYVDYKLTEREVSIEADGPGAYVVKVDDADLEATTMVLVTDLGLIVKASRQELLAFAQNLADERVEAGVRVIVSDGNKVVTEGITDAGGMFKWRGPELVDCEELRVFAVDGAGSGAGTLGLSGLERGEGLSPKAYLFTDRPAYRPGGVANFKGIVREVRDGLYTLPAADGGYRVQVVTPNGAALLDREIEFTEFGTFAAELPLPADAPLGAWQVRVRGLHGRLQSSIPFQVARYELPRLALSIETDRNIAFRGESITGRLLLTHFYGEPAVGRAITYRLTMPDGTFVDHTGETNAEGAVAFSFETRDFAEEAVAWVQGFVVGEDVSATRVVPVVTTELEPRVATLRDVYLSGEPFDATIHLTDRAGKAVAREVKVTLLRRERRGGTLAETAVQSVAVRTEGSDGRGVASLTATAGGEHVIRVEVVDRAGTTISADRPVTISGVDDEVKLRLLSDREAWRVGDTLQVQVVRRGEPRLALRTLQADGVLAAEVVRIPSGTSVMELPLTSEHAPNFGLALAMIDGVELRTAQRDFLVSREMQIEIVAPPGDLEPGSEIAVDVLTRDAHGRPVAAEVALSMVDVALLAIHSDATADPATFFFGGRRQTAFRTVSSCGWVYAGVSRTVSAELLAEDRRRAEPARPVADPEAPDDSSTTRGEFGNSPTAGAGGGPGAGLSSAGRFQSPGQSQAGDKQREALGEVQQQVQYAGGEGGGFAAHFKDAMGQSKNAELPMLGAQIDTHAAFRFALYDRDDAGLGVDSRASLGLDEPRIRFAGDGAWLSAVTTDADGRATVKLQVPATTARWRLTVRGVTRNTDVGAAHTELVTARDLVPAIAAPTALVVGDRVMLQTSIHNRGAERTAATVDITVGDAIVAEQVTLEAGAERAWPRELIAAEAGEIEVAVRATRDDRTVADERTVSIQPFGVEHRVGRSGVTGDGARAELQLPAGRTFTDRALRIEVGPDPARSLVAAALGAGDRPWNCRQIERTNLAIAARGLSAAAVIDRFERIGGGDRVDRRQLESAVDSAVAALIGGQDESGAFRMVAGGPADLRTTAAAVRLLAAARRLGVHDAERELERGVQWLREALRLVRDHAQIDAALALAEAGQARFETLNALHRRSAELPLEQRARLGLAWWAADRGERAREIAEQVRGALPVDGSDDPSRVEAVALAVQLLARVDPRDPAAVAGVAWLERARRGASFGSPTATAAAVTALAIAGGTTVAAADDATVVVTVGGRDVARVVRRDDRPVEAIVIRGEQLPVDPVVVGLRVEGRAQAHWSVLLTGFAEGFAESDRNDALARVRRRYEPAHLRIGGRAVAPGFDVVSGEHESFRNEMTELPVGSSGRVEVEFEVRTERGGDLTTIVLEEPIPAGCSVPRDSISGNFEHVEMLPDRLVCYFRDEVTTGAVRYELVGRFEGSFRALPTEIYGAERPDLVARGEVGRLTIVPRGQAVADEYRMTPDELYQLGSDAFGNGDRARAEELLGRLVDGWPLRDDVHSEVARMMLFAAIAKGEARAVVRWFEEVKDRAPNLVVPFGDIVAVGRAYQDLGEFEAALLVFRATAEASFLKDAAVATTLEQRGEIEASVRFLRKLLDTYPGLNTMRQSLYGIGQKLGMLAARIPDGAPVDERVGTREALREQSLATFREFLVRYPDDELAGEVTFAWVTTLIEMRSLDEALRIADSALQRFAGTDLEDELLYTVGFARFVLGSPQDALVLLRRVAAEEFRTSGGGRGPSENRAHSIYLEGQIHHAAGEIPAALEYYDRVREQFADAGEAAAWFRRSTLSLPEVATFATGKPASVKLSYRNLTDVELVVYRVDLMRLYLLEKSLSGIRDVKLHGIQPHHREKVGLEGQDFSDHDREVTLPLDESGAYLVVARSGEHIASGMVLRSDLTLELQEELDVGRVRVNVKRNGAFLGDAHVKVVGSGDGRLRQGDTDLRGVFVADDLLGLATVIVRDDAQYAFYRGSGVHQPDRFQPPPAQRMDLERKPQHDAQQSEGKSFDAWENNIRLNTTNRDRQIRWLQEEVLDNKQQGVEVFRTK